MVAIASLSNSPAGRLALSPTEAVMAPQPIEEAFVASALGTKREKIGPASPRAPRSAARVNVWRAANLVAWTGLALCARAAAASSTPPPDATSWPYGTFGTGGICYGIWRSFGSSNGIAYAAGSDTDKFWKLLQTCGDFG